MTSSGVFDETGPLPTGTALLEASAGTGKTYTITTLVLRLIVEADLDIDQVVVVTFTRAAAAELRGRIRGRIHDAVNLLEQQQAGMTVAFADDDAVVAHLAQHRGLEPALERLRRARERFDEATIDTIHGFCQRVLQHSGAELGVDPSSELRDDVDDIARTVVNDLLVRSVRHAEPGWFRLLDDEIRGDGDLADRLVRVVRTVAGRPYLQLRPDDETDPAAAWSGVCGAFREAWRAESDILIDWINRTQQDRGFRSKTAYTPAVIERLRDDVDAWCAMASPPLGGALPDIDALAWVTRHAIDAALVEPTDVPEGLVVVDRAAEVIELRVRVATLFVRRFVTEAVAELDRRTADAGVWTFDDLLIVLDRALADPRRAGVVTAAIRQRFSAALIDEFQDTDPIQWRIFSALFGDDEGRLLLIGDPKQAIYGFRGADIRTYLQAVTGTDEGNRWTLEVNHRSDQRFLDALERLFLRDDVGDEGVFAVPDIRFRQVRATELHQTDGLTYQGDPRPALEIRVATRDQFSTDEGDPIALGRVRPVLPRYVAQEIDELLHSDVHFVNRTGPAAGDGGAVHRMLRPGDIAVLTRTRRQATQVQDALRARGISAVVGVDESVLDSPEAVAVERLLAAMNAAPDERAARAAAASSIVGMTASVFAEADSDAWDGFMTDVARWTAQWRTDGVAAALRTAMVERTTAARLLSLRRGERAVTNLVHLIEVLHVEETVAGRGPAALLEWLADQRHRPDRRADALELRLENDADAVQVMTVHRAKGLQYPVVWCPFLWDDVIDRAGGWPVIFGDGDTTAVDINLDRQATPSVHAQASARREAWEEQLRLAYVALTRARHRCVVHLGPIKGVAASALGRLIFGTHPSSVSSDGTLEFSPDPSRWSDAEVAAAVADVANGLIEVTTLDDFGADVGHRDHHGEPPALAVRRLSRPVDRSWQRTSFSRLVRDAIADDDGRATVEGEGPDEFGKDFDQFADVQADTSPAGDAAVSMATFAASERPIAHGTQVPMAALPRGANIGTFIHAVLERLDFRAADDPAHVAQVIEELPGAMMLSPAQRIDLAAGLSTAVSTPLGPLAQGRSLADIDPTDRRDELVFDLPIAGGDRPTGMAVSVHRIAEVFSHHARSADAPLARAADRLRSRNAVPSRGFLTGSIDLVARIDGRYLIADHKSNWIGETDRQGRAISTVEHYAPDRLNEQMVSHDYLLQLHLYVVALHRFLRSRVADYSYDTHVAGAIYLFLRGMTGAGGPTGADGTPYGVFALRPSEAVIEDLDAVLRGEG